MTTAMQGFFDLLLLGLTGVGEGEKGLGRRALCMPILAISSQQPTGRRASLVRQPCKHSLLLFHIAWRCKSACIVIHTGIHQKQKIGIHTSGANLVAVKIKNFYPCCWPKSIVYPNHLSLTTLGHRKPSRLLPFLQICIPPPRMSRFRLLLLLSSSA